MRMSWALNGIGSDGAYNITKAAADVFSSLAGSQCHFRNSRLFAPATP
jgi:hypothetical protein